MSNFVTALCVNANGQSEEAVQHLKASTAINVNWTPDMYWARMLLDEWDRQ
jgi:hypothetical protein